MSCVPDVLTWDFVGQPGYQTKVHLGHLVLAWICSGRGDLPVREKHILQ